MGDDGVVLYLMVHETKKHVGIDDVVIIVVDGPLMK